MIGSTFYLLAAAQLAVVLAAPSPYNPYKVGSGSVTNIERREIHELQVLQARKATVTVTATVTASKSCQHLGSGAYMLTKVKLPCLPQPHLLQPLPTRMKRQRPSRTEHSTPPQRSEGITSYKPLHSPDHL